MSGDRPPAFPGPDLSRPPTQDELDEATRAMVELWPAILLLIMNGHGTVQGYVKDGRLEKTDLSLMMRRSVCRR
jgi:hypothetical protein